MAPNNQEELSKLKEKELLSERAKAESELSKLREFMLAEVDIDPEEGDSEVSEREKNAALIAVLERKVNNIDAALQSMQKGQYGICDRCGEPIEPERLEIKPDATLCVPCQREVERLSRRGR
ncbi:MAG: TraR/DksA C4-type zinc finger protein [Chloroflexota bacterium]